ATWKIRKYSGSKEATNAYASTRKSSPATNKTQPVIAAQAIAVPRSGWKTIRAIKINVGTTAGRTVFRQSFMDFVRLSRKNARKRMSAGLAISLGCKDSGPQ